jgi:hypothetical protein
VYKPKTSNGIPIIANFYLAHSADNYLTNRLFYRRVSHAILTFVITKIKKSYLFRIYRNNMFKKVPMRNQKGGDATSLPYEFYNPLAGDFPQSYISPGIPTGSPVIRQVGGGKSINQRGGDATPLPKSYFNPILAHNANPIFCGVPNDYIDYLYRGNCARCTARQSLHDGPYNPQSLTLTGWQGPDSFDSLSNTPTVQQFRADERTIVTPPGMIAQPITASGSANFQVGGQLSGVNRGAASQVNQRGGGTYGAPFYNHTFGCGPADSPNSGLSYRFNECDLQTGVSFVPL